LSGSIDPAINTPDSHAKLVGTSVPPLHKKRDGRQNKAGEFHCNPAHVVVGVVAPQNPLHSGDEKPRATHTQPWC
jgi:hypothetical protein